MKYYHDEAEGQRAFYERVGINPDLHHSTDGIDRGNLYENKIDVPNIYKFLFQAVKYASRIRERGELLPANIIINDLNRETAYIFQSVDLLPEIEKVYFGGASKNNDNYPKSIANAKYVTIDYSEVTGLQVLLKYVTSENFVRYHIDKNNILGLSRQFYKVNQDKDAFIKGANAEIRKPSVLTDRIYPYTKADNLEFEDIMDCLNPQLLQREQGAYYTPLAYVQQMHKMLYKAIEQVPADMDYVIIDRCAGVGNLEEGLRDDVLEHCILSTIEFNEYAILRYKYGDKCLVVIPNTDALAYDIIPAEHNEQGVSNDYVREKVQDENCVIILLENPPYSEVAAGSVQNSGGKENEWKKSFVIGEMKKDKAISGVVFNDLSNLFIWSGFKYYLTKHHDSYILYSPTKYWRTQNLVNREMADGFLCNRKWFHASQVSAIGCIWWKNIEDNTTKSLTLTPYDIIGNLGANPGQTIRARDGESEVDDITIRKAYKTLAEGFDNRPFLEDTSDGIVCERDGSEFDNNGRKNYVKPLYNKNIVGYLTASNFQIDRKDVVLTRCGLYKAHGFWLRSDNFCELLPIFVAATFPYDKWWKTDVYSKSYDGGGAHLADAEFLKRCLVYTALTPKNKCRSLMGSDGRFYRNELCFDGDTLAQKAIDAFLEQGLELLDVEEDLLKYWSDVFYQAKKTTEFKKRTKVQDWRYGLWQIMQELDVKIQQGVNRDGTPKMVYKYNTLHSEIGKLDAAIKKYYAEYIIPLLFKYELIK